MIETTFSIRPIAPADNTAMAAIIRSVMTQFGAGGPKLLAWQNQVANLLPTATGANAPVVDLTQPGLSVQSRSVVVTMFWQLPGESGRHQLLLTAQIGKNI